MNPGGPSAAATTFPRFGELAPETRQEIWRFAALAHVPSVCFYTGKGNDQKPNDVQQPVNQALLLTCTEAHDVAVKTGRIKRRPFDPALDILWVVNDLALAKLYGRCGGSTQLGVPEPWITRVKHLALSLPTTSLVNFDYNNNPLPYCIKEMLSLQKISVAFPQGWDQRKLDWLETQPGGHGLDVDVPAVKKRPFQLRQLTAPELQDIIAIENILMWPPLGYPSGKRTPIDGRQFLMAFRLALRGKCKVDGDIVHFPWHPLQPRGLAVEIDGRVLEKSVRDGKKRFCTRSFQRAMPRVQK